MVEYITSGNWLPRESGKHNNQLPGPLRSAVPPGRLLIFSPSHLYPSPKRGSRPTLHTYFEGCSCSLPLSLSQHLPSDTHTACLSSSVPTPVPSVLFSCVFTRPAYGESEKARGMGASAENTNPWTSNPGKATVSSIFTVVFLLLPWFHLASEPALETCRKSGKNSRRQGEREGGRKGERGGGGE